MREYCGHTVFSSGICPMNCIVVNDYDPQGMADAKNRIANFHCQSRLELERIPIKMLSYRAPRSQFSGEPNN